MTGNLEYLGFDYPIAAKDNKTLLNDFGPGALENYRKNKRELLTWLLTKRQNPFREKGSVAASKTSVSWLSVLASLHGSPLTRPETLRRD